MRHWRIHYGWVVAAVTFPVLLAAAGFRSTVGVLMPLQDEFGWGRDQVAGAIAVNPIFDGLAAPFAAAFVERVGVRRVMIAGLAAVGGGAALTVLMTSPGSAT